jgi:hypothetical protein
VTAGTIFHKTRVGLRHWFWAIYRMSQGKEGIAALQLAKEIGVSYPTAWRMARKIRKAMADREPGRKQRGDDPGLMKRFYPWVPILVSNLQGFLLGTHRQPQPRHLDRYVAECRYRFHRRRQERSLCPRLTRACLSTNTITYKDLTAHPELA